MIRRLPALSLPAVALAALLPAVLTGCSHTPATQFHTLVPGVASQAVPSAGFSFRIDSPVAVPAQVDRPQMVLRHADGSVQVLEQQRWVAPLAEEWPAVVAERIAQRSGGLDATRLTAPGPVYRVQLALQRFEMSAAGSAMQQVQWSLFKPGQAAPALGCLVAVDGSAGPEPAALAAAQRQLTMQVGDGIAAALRSLQQSGSARCP
jgi:uncharacterized lipoprotein YmbA